MRTSHYSQDYQRIPILFCRTRGSSGIVKLNDVVRDQSPRYRKLSAYIPQDEELRLALTAKEAMTFAANLKLGHTVTSEYKMQQVLLLCII